MAPPKGKPVWSREKKGFFAFSSIVLVVLAELTLRLGFGLGRPLLMMPHPTIEYLAQPNQEVRRFGHRVSYNQYSMRSPSFSREKQDAREFRVLLIGDSVVNGGSTLDQSELATTEVEQVLTRQWERPVIVMNVSAGSWGPENQLAYVREYGFFDADAAVVVWSTHDFDDVPVFGPLNPRSHPVSVPFSALSEAAFRYGIPLLQGISDSLSAPKAQDSALDGKRRAEGAMRALLSSLTERGPVLVLLHLTQPELAALPEEDILFVRQLSSESKAHFENLGPSFARALARGSEPYRSADPIHTTPAGQHVIARHVLEWLHQERSHGSLRDD